MTEATIQFRCSRCGTVYQVNSSLLGERGRIARCVICNHRFAVRFTASDVALETAEEPIATALRVEADQEPPLFLEETAEGVAGLEEAEITQVRRAGRYPEVEMPIEPRSEETQKGKPLPPVEMPDQSATPFGMEPVDVSLETRRRWRDPMRAEKKKTALFGLSTEAKQPTSGVLYKVIIIAVGVLAFITSFLNLAAWRIDPLWSLTLVLIGIAAFRMQSLSGILVAGIFCFFYPLALFSVQVPAIVGGEMTGVMVIAAQTAFAVIILLTYGILVARKGALFVLREGSAQSIVAGLLAVLVLVIALWAHIDSTTIPSLGKLAVGGTALDSITYYSSTHQYGIPLSVLIQGWALSLAVAFGFSARAVRNRLLMLTIIAVLIGFLALLLLYAPLVLGQIKFQLF
jgi:predicted Zn finger-like uncharacterized protein